MASKFWKDAASIIIAARSPFSKSTQVANNVTNNRSADYKVLVLKRGKTSSFMPGTYVFPGGVVEPSDSTPEWLDLYQNLGFDISNIKDNVSDDQFIYRNRDPDIHKQVSLRITAIRETFEECGILLCKSKGIHKEQTSSWTSYFYASEVNDWRVKVHKEPSKFLDLCKHFECVPDIWGLHQWSNWLTPRSEKLRFDTIFFLSTIDQMPPAAVDNKEMDDLKWSEPSELIQRNSEGSIRLPPPQMYELSRIEHFDQINSLNSFAEERSKLGCDCWMPILTKAANGLLHLLPGDDMYPISVDKFTKEPAEILSEKLCDLHNGRTNLHRIEYGGPGKNKIVTVNIQATRGHILP